MKKVLLPVLFTIVSLLSVNAQEKEQGKGFSKEDTYISGTLSFNSTTVSDFDVEATEFNFSPAIGYFISDNIALEGLLFIGNSSSNDGFDEIKTNVFGGGLGANYYFTPMNKFSLTTGVSFSYLISTPEFNGSELPSTNIFTFAIVPGLNYFITESFSLRASVGALSYTTSKLDVEGASSTNQFSLNVDLSDINFGLSYKF